MSIKVIGAGFGRTGTLSLKIALEELGFGKCYHMVELFRNRDEIVEWEHAFKGREPDWDTVFTGYQSTVDFPGCLYYADLIKKYPDAKVVLTHRDPASWYKSAYSTILTSRPRPGQLLKILIYYPFSDKARKILRVGLHNKTLIENSLFGGRVKDEQHVMKVFEQHLEQVKRTVPSERLLTYQVSEGWDPLCQFLDVPVPPVEFPISNMRGDFDEGMLGLLFSL